MSPEPLNQATPPQQATSEFEQIPIPLPGPRMHAKQPRKGALLQCLSDLDGFVVRASDGTIGYVRDFYVDDETWVVRYLVVETGSWLPSREVLVSPLAIGRPNWTRRVMPVSTTKCQVSGSPRIDIGRPITREHEMQYLAYYGFPYYWGSVGSNDQEVYPDLMLLKGDSDRANVGEPEDDTVNVGAGSKVEIDKATDRHLLSFKTLRRCDIDATDGHVGYLRELLFDEPTWSIRYVVVATSRWWPGHRVLIAPKWIQALSCYDSKITVSLTRQAVKNATPYDVRRPLGRIHELPHYRHLRHLGCWLRQL